MPYPGRPAMAAELFELLGQTLLSKDADGKIKSVPTTVLEGKIIGVSRAGLTSPCAALLAGPTPRAPSPAAVWRPAQQLLFCVRAGVLFGSLVRERAPCCSQLGGRALVAGPRPRGQGEGEGGVSRRAGAGPAARSRPSWQQRTRSCGRRARTLRWCSYRWTAAWRSSRRAGRGPGRREGLPAAL